jgi:hypothetical protein
VLGDRGQVVAVGQIVARLAHDGSREAIIHIPETQRAAIPLSGRRLRVRRPGRRCRLLRFPAHRSVTRTFQPAKCSRATSRAFRSARRCGSPLGPDQAGFTRVPIGALHDPGDGPASG